MSNPMTAPALQPGPGDFVERMPGARWAVVPVVGATAVYWDFDPGATVPRHNHFHAQFLVVLSGSIDLIFDDKTVTVGAGQVLNIPPFQFHAAQVKEPVRCIDIFVPTRGEYEEEYAAKRGA